MAYRVKHGEAVAHAVPRMARAELLAAADSIANESGARTDRIHGARTSIKKTRALLRLVRPTVGRAARRENRRLRDLASTAAAFRDAGVVLDTFDALVATLPAARRRPLARVRQRLEAAFRAEEQRLFADGKHADLGDRLRRRAKRVRSWAPPSGSWRAVGPGLVDGYRRARRAMTAAYRAENTGAFHEWRRAVKTHRYHMQALEPLAPATMGPRVGPLDRLGEVLGEEHDLSVLAAALDRQRQEFAAAEDRDVLLRALAGRQTALRADARALGESLFQAGPSHFGRLVHAELRERR